MSLTEFCRAMEDETYRGEERLALMGIADSFQTDPGEIGCLSLRTIVYWARVDKKRARQIVRKFLEDGVIIEEECPKFLKDLDDAETTWFRFSEAFYSESAPRQRGVA